MAKDRPSWHLVTRAHAHGCHRQLSRTPRERINKQAQEGAGPSPPGLPEANPYLEGLQTPHPVAAALFGGSVVIAAGPAGKGATCGAAPCQVGLGVDPCVLLCCPPQLGEGWGWWGARLGPWVGSWEREGGDPLPLPSTGDVLGPVPKVGGWHGGELAWLDSPGAVTGPCRGAAGTQVSGCRRCGGGGSGEG